MHLADGPAPDLADTTDRVGAGSFASFAKGSRSENQLTSSETSQQTVCVGDIPVAVHGELLNWAKTGVFSGLDAMPESAMSSSFWSV